jgi:hypothetical protein
VSQTPLAAPLDEIEAYGTEERVQRGQQQHRHELHWRECHIDGGLRTLVAVSNSTAADVPGVITRKMRSSCRPPIRLNVDALARRVNRAEVMP